MTAKYVFSHKLDKITVFYTAMTVKSAFISIAMAIHSMIKLILILISVMPVYKWKKRIINIGKFKKNNNAKFAIPENSSL